MLGDVPFVRTYKPGRMFIREKLLPLPFKKKPEPSIISGAKIKAIWIWRVIGNKILPPTPLKIVW